MSLYLSRVKLTNVRGFKQLDLAFGTPKKSRRWTVVIGDNGHGKSALLRAIGIGLCNESDASALLKELTGDFIRINRAGKPETEAKIELQLTTGGNNPTVHEIITTVKRDESNTEIVRKQTSAAFPWSEIFVCGYGVNRGTRGTGKWDRYTPFHGLRSLFDDHVDLLDPEATLQALQLRAYQAADAARAAKDQRQASQARALASRRKGETELFKQAKDALWRIWEMNPNHQLDVYADRVVVHGPWGGLPFHALGDGYRGTAGWVLDLLGYAIKADRWSAKDFRAVVLLDEVEEHLHPRWQKTIIPNLKKVFPGVQFIATTHSPLTLVNTEPDEVVATVLRNAVARLVDDPLPPTDGKTVNEILLGDWFGLSSVLDSKSEKLLKAYRKALKDGDKAKQDRLR